MKSDNIKLITKLWTSKEAIFKCIYENKLSLKKNIVVEKFDIHSTFGQGEVYLNDNHPYDTPFIAELNSKKINTRYLEWITKNL